MTIKPMRGVAPKGELSNYPYLVSPKIDGLRAWVKEGVVLSKTGKPFRNKHIQKLFGHLHGFDGELVVGKPYKTSPEDDVFARSRGPIMSMDQEADFKFYVFDLWDLNDMHAGKRVTDVLVDRCLDHDHKDMIWSYVVNSREETDFYTNLYLNVGYEGVMLRQVNSPYKYGQSTEKEGYLLKIKPFVDSDAVIIGYTEQEANTNEAEIDELGYTKRSSSKGGKVGKGTFGSFIVRDLVTGVEFNVGNGPGLTYKMRDELWADRDNLIGKYIKYKYQEVGTVSAPRLPQFLSFRDPEDISELAQ